MQNDYKSPAFKKLLDSLQQQSWELELLISGFAIFGLFTALEPLEIGIQEAGNDDNTLKVILYIIALISCYILLFNLLLHVILRGLWIGALGLRYVSGDIEFDKLNYSEKFKNYLSKRIVSFDRYIGRLENYCSVLFAISFLLIFYVLAITMVNLALVFVATSIIDNDLLPGWLQKALGIPLLLFLIIGMFLTFFDFVTQGLLKKNKWVAKAYFPFYWIFSFLTLSFLYRPLIYNFLDNKFGKKLILMLVPGYILILGIASIDYKDSNFLNSSNSSSANFANKENYMDMLLEKTDYPGTVVLSSKVVRTPFLQVFLPFREKIEDHIFSYNPKLKPKNDQRGLTSSIVIGWKDADDKFKNINKDSIYNVYLETVNETYFFNLDTLHVDSPLIVATTPKGKLGFETYLNLGNIEEGKHDFVLKRLEKQDDSTIVKTEAIIPFWYFKE